MSRTLTDAFMIGSDSDAQPKRYVIVHGHFYQPPRENPWIDIIEQQPSAAPAHDWNERIYDQCYRPNAYSRLLDSHGMITDIHNNYSKISFNFGPTLFGWLESKHPSTAQRIIAADEESRKTNEGHGNGIAQVFNHIIMPLASRRDQLTQIRWAKHFFKNRFGRNPEGFWLAETAINMETVMCLIEERVRFVILSPNQIESFRLLHEHAEWTATSAKAIDSRRPYRVFPKDAAGNRLPGYLDIFLFDEGLSKEISFGDLLTDAQIFGNRIATCYDQHLLNDQVVVLATDGETFGHHKPFGDMCLAYFFEKIAPRLGITPVNFGYYLSKNPPRHEASLKNAFGEGTAWSCAHGVGRWVRNCGCKTGGLDTWKQEWRTPLRQAFKMLQKRIDTHFETEISKMNVDPWKLRDDYIAISEDLAGHQFKHFLVSQRINQELPKSEVFYLRRLLEAQKYMLFSFTSCAWFFSDISGIEAKQNLAYAARALQLGIPDHEQETALKEMLATLEKSVSNIPAENGRTIFEKEIRPYMQHLHILAFTAASEKTVEFKKDNSFQDFNYKFEIERLFVDSRDGLSYNGWKVQIENHFSGEQARMAVLISHRNGAEVRGWVAEIEKLHRGQNAFVIDDWIGNKASKHFTSADTFITSKKQMTEYFLTKIMRDTDSRFEAWYKNNERALDALSRIGSPLPSYCIGPIAFVFKEQWDRLIIELGKNGVQNDIFSALTDLSDLAKQYGVVIDLSQCSRVLENFLVAEFQRLSEILDPEICDRIRFLMNVVDRFSIPVSKNKLEDIFLPVLKGKVKLLYDRTMATPSEKVELLIDKKDLLLRLLSFARRMNFATDSFHIS